MHGDRKAIISSGGAPRIQITKFFQVTATSPVCIMSQFLVLSQTRSSDTPFSYHSMHEPQSNAKTVTKSNSTHIRSNLMSLLSNLITVVCLCIHGTNACTVDQNKFNDILSDLENKGYTVDIGRHIYLNNSTEYGANPNGIYGVYEFKWLAVQEDLFWYIPGESAMIFHGCSPPNASYYSYRSYLGKEAGINVFPQTFASLGDSTNQLVINYTGSASPFDALISIVTTGDQITYSDITASFTKYELQNTLNLDSIPSVYNDVIFGKDQRKSDIFTMLSRIAIPFDVTAYHKYINQTWPVYFLSRGNKTIEQFQPRQKYELELRNKTSEINEFEIYSESLHKLTETVTSYFEQTYKMSLAVRSQLRTDALNGTECIEYNSACLRDNEDACYFNSNFNASNYSKQLMTDDRFYVVLGVNHNTINQTVYSSVGIYKLTPGYPRYSQIGGITNFDPNFANSAVMFDPSLENVAQMFAVTVARPQNCELMNGKDVPCLGVNEQKIGDIDPFIFVTRAYLNPSTQTGPSYEQIIPDVVLEFNIA